MFDIAVYEPKPSLARGFDCRPPVSEALRQHQAWQAAKRRMEDVTATPVFKRFDPTRVSVADAEEAKMLQAVIVLELAKWIMTRSVDQARSSAVRANRDAMKAPAHMLRRAKSISDGVDVDDKTAPGPSVRCIIRVVAEDYGVSCTDVLSARRTACLVRPRQVACYIARTLTLRSLPDIGRRFGGRDHTTILHAFRKIEALIKTDSELASRVARLRAMIEGATR